MSDSDSGAGLESVESVGALDATGVADVDGAGVVGADRTEGSTAGSIADLAGPSLDLADEFDAADAEDDQLEKAQARARLQAMLFGEPSEPVRMGRFVLLDRLGQGGMGVVYSAYDPQLDRRVALKLVRTHRNESRDARERLLREAQALARLSHPNVVPVYDVGLLDGQVFIVMEFVVGRTLRAWAQDEERAWREVLDAYLQAGAGLAAAHQVDLVHRDFKPDNAVVGDDGRIRVLDFGLARGHRADDGGEGEREDETASDADTDAEPGGDVDVEALAETAAVAFESTVVHSQVNTRDASIGALDTRLPESDFAVTRKRLDISMTATGAVIGTPAYMSPEQFDGKKLGPETDQFSFCASLYEGLYGARPFTGYSLGELGANIKSGELPEPDRSAGVPSWLHEVVRRGLRPNPTERYPSMDGLLEALQADPALPRRRWLVGLLVLSLLGLVAYLLATREQAPAVEVCKGGGAEIASVWNPERRDGLKQTILGIERAYAKEAWPRIDQGLTGYAERFANMHRSACLAHRRGEQSGSLLDKRMACLDKRRTSLASAVDVLGETTADTLANAVEAVSKLPDIDYCADREAMEAEIPPPGDPEVARQVEALQKKLARARALEDAGRYTEAVSVAKDIEIAARALNFAPLTVESLLIEGRATLSLDQHGEAVAPLEAATTAGLAAGLDELGLEALARRVFASGVLLRPKSESVDWLPWIDALTQRASNRSFIRALLLNNLGVVAMSRGEREDALHFYERALAIKNESNGSDYIELLNIYLNFALVTEDASRRMRLLTHAHDEFAQALGKTHPKALLPSLMAAFWTTSLIDAHERLESICSDYRRFHPEEHNRLATCLYRLGLVLAERGKTKAALEQFQLVVTVLEAGKLTSQARPTLMLARAYVAFHRNDLSLSRKLFIEALQYFQKGEDLWWMKERIARTHLGVALSEFAAARYSEAAAALEQALPIFEEIAPIDPNASTKRHLANTRALLAKSIWNAGRRAGADKQRISVLLRSAEDWYRSAGRGDEQRVASLVAWRAKRGISE